MHMAPRISTPKHPNSVFLSMMCGLEEKRREQAGWMEYSKRDLSKRLPEKETEAFGSTKAK